MLPHKRKRKNQTWMIRAMISTRRDHARLFIDEHPVAPSVPCDENYVDPNLMRTDAVSTVSDVTQDLPLESDSVIDVDGFIETGSQQLASVIDRMKLERSTPVPTPSLGELNIEDEPVLNDVAPSTSMEAIRQEDDNESLESASTVVADEQRGRVAALTEAGTSTDYTVGPHADPSMNVMFHLFHDEVLRSWARSYAVRQGTSACKESNSHEEGYNS